MKSLIYHVDSSKSQAAPTVMAAIVTVLAVILVAIFVLELGA